MPRTIEIDADLEALIRAYRNARDKRRSTPEDELAIDNENLTAHLVALAVANRVEAA